MTKRILSRNEIIRRDRSKAFREQAKFWTTAILVLLGTMLWTGMGNAM